MALNASPSTKLALPTARKQGAGAERKLLHLAVAIEVQETVSRLALLTLWCSRSASKIPGRRRLRPPSAHLPTWSGFGSPPFPYDFCRSSDLPEEPASQCDVASAPRGVVTVGQGKKMFCTPLSGAVAALIMGVASTVAFAQTTPKPGEQAGCTTANGVAVGAGCQKEDNGSAAGGVENGMPATKHQQELLKTDDKAAKGGNMEAAGARGRDASDQASAGSAHEEARDSVQRRSEADALAWAATR